MKKILPIAAAILVIGGCAKQPNISSADANRRFFEAWMHVNHSNLEKMEGSHGIYILEDLTDGTDPSREDYNKLDFDKGNIDYLLVRYTAKNLDGDITETNEKIFAKQLGQYDTTYYYGPKVWSNSYYSLPTGVKDMFRNMNIGQKRTAIIPGWLMDKKQYDTEEEYLQKVTSLSPAIYTVELIDTAKNIYNKQIEAITKLKIPYLDKAGNPQIWEVSEEDAAYKGFYYHEIDPGDHLNEKAEEKPGFDDGTPIKILYTGRLIKGIYEPGAEIAVGQVFDTTDKDTAKNHNIYNSSKTYNKGVSAKWSSDSTAVTLNSSSIIEGFASTLCRMKHYEARGIGVFYSASGYGTSGSGSIIPAYAPLIFEIAIEKKEE